MDSYLIWYIVAGILLLFEAFSPGVFIFICFAAASLVAGIVDQFSDLGLTTLLIIALVLSTINLLLIKPVLKSIIKMPDSEQTLYANQLLGREAMVFKAITAAEPGLVKLIDFDETWMAKSVDGSEIGQGTAVEIVELQGTTVIVKSKV